MPLTLVPRRRAIARWVLSAALLTLVPAGGATAAGQDRPPPPAPAAHPDSDFVTLYPGVYTDKEAPLVKAYLDANAALQRRGPIDVRALVAGTLPRDTPGLGPVVKADAAWVQYNNRKYDPTSRLRNDAAYARSLGFRDVLAYPTFGTNDDVFMIPYPGPARDKLLVSELNHSVVSYRPIYPGDTLYPVADERIVLDITPPGGSTYRNLVIQTKGSVYNQRGEKVNDVVFRVSENVRVLKPGLAPANAGFMDVWVAPDWMKDRPAHFYTDADWQTIRAIWAKETVRGATPLYWEDVAVGDRPAWTLDGPIQASVSPIKPWGQGAGGSRTLKREILDAKTFATMLRGEKDGIWRMPERRDNIPLTPPIDATAGGPPPPNGEIDTTNIHKEGAQRSILVNYMGRDLAIRQVQNWMGDRGWIEQIRWSIMDPRALARVGLQVPHDPLAEHWLDEVPSMRGRFVDTHGMTQDVAITKSEVVSKYVKDGRHLVDLVWWIETIDGRIFEEGKTSVRLPSRAGAPEVAPAGAAS